MDRDEREVILKLRGGDVATMRWEIGDDIVRCKDCKYLAPDGACDHPSEWDNGESRNHYKVDWYCADGERKG